MHGLDHIRINLISRLAAAVDHLEFFTCQILGKATGHLAAARILAAGEQYFFSTDQWPDEISGRFFDIRQHLRVFGHILGAFYFAVGQAAFKAGVNGIEEIFGGQLQPFK